MKDVLCPSVFAGKMLCLIVFVTVLKPDGGIGAIRTATQPIDCRIERPRSAGMRPEALCGGFASRREALHREHRLLLNHRPTPQSP
jgi:hypothetical protein